MRLSRFAPLALVPALLLARAPAAGAQEQVRVSAAGLDSVRVKLDGFVSGLDGRQRAAWADLLVRAAAAPADDPAGTRVPARTFRRMPGRASYQARTAGPSGAAADSQGIVVQGGRTASQGIVVQGGRTANQGIIVQGGRTAADSAARRPWGDPHVDESDGAIVAQLTEFGATLRPEEQAVVDWLLARAARAPEGVKQTMQTQVRAAAPQTTLQQALGIRAGARAPGGWTLIVAP